jgi:hypothetical protein
MSYPKDLTREQYKVFKDKNNKRIEELSKEINDTNKEIQKISLTSEQNNKINAIQSEVNKINQELEKYKDIHPDEVAKMRLITDEYKYRKNLLDSAQQSCNNDERYINSKASAAISKYRRYGSRVTNKIYAQARGKINDIRSRCDRTRSEITRGVASKVKNKETVNIDVFKIYNEKYKDMPSLRELRKQRNTKLKQIIDISLNSNNALDNQFKDFRVGGDTGGKKSGRNSKGEKYKIVTLPKPNMEVLKNANGTVVTANRQDPAWRDTFNSTLIEDGKDLYVNRIDKVNGIYYGWGQDLHIKIREKPSKINIDREKLIQQIDERDAKLDMLNEADIHYSNKIKKCSLIDEKIRDAEKEMNEISKTLISFENQHKTCMTNYNNKCSDDAKTKLAEKEQAYYNLNNELSDKQDSYNKYCKGTPLDCSPYSSEKDRLNAKADGLREKIADITQQHIICMDPTRNKCKDLYYDTHKKLYDTKTEVRKIKEDFTNSIYDTHDEINTTYKSNLIDNNNLTKRINEIEENRTAYSTYSKKNLDSTIYTNIMLTTLATSLLYYTMFEL